MVRFDTGMSYKIAPKKFYKWTVLVLYKHYKWNRYN